MSELTRLLQRLHDGEVAVEDAAATIAWLVSTIPDGEKSTDERLCTFEIIQLKMEGVLGDPADSFSQVEVAHLAGRADRRAVRRDQDRRRAGRPAMSTGMVTAPCVFGRLPPG